LFDGIHDACFRSSCSLPTKHYQFSAVMRNAHKANRCPMCAKYRRKERSERYNVVRGALIPLKGVTLIAHCGTIS
jgi:hypothetical protein